MVEDSALLSYIRDHIIKDFIDELVLEGVITIAIANRLKLSVRKPDEDRAAI